MKWSLWQRNHELERGPVAGLVFSLFLLIASSSMTQGVESVPAPILAMPATDGLGRAMPMPGEVSGPRPDRFVGMFYFLWHDNRAAKRHEGDGPYDISTILARDPDAIHHPRSPLWGPIGVYHYWGEPLFGYYQSTDPWVIRRHARLLADAGVDTLIFDTTNTETYPDVYHRLCEVFREIRKSGGRTPGIAFMMNTNAGVTGRQVYRDLYAPGKFRDLWFVWRGKPLLICDPTQADAELRGFFTLRRAHWPHRRVNTPYAWHWEATYPQPYGYTDDSGRAEQVNVSVAQNLRASDGRPTNMSVGNGRGRSFHDGARDLAPGALDRGGNFQEQWKRVFDLEPPFAMVTGWNEWIAGRWGEPDSTVEFVDQFDREFSRDIEPMQGGHGDSYYYQLVANVRRYKGISAIPKASSPRSIDLDVGFESWKDVAPEFVDDAGDTSPRDHDGAGGTHFVNRSGRNDLVACKVARDERHVFFYARTRADLTPRTDRNWMELLIDADRDPRTGWEGFDFILNRIVEVDGTTWLERNVGGWKWEKVGKVRTRVSGTELQLAIPRFALGIPEGSGGLAIDFKWTDNVQHPGDILDFYVSGDVAPEGRFKFRYIAD
jgi:hypothetical protein